MARILACGAFLKNSACLLDTEACAPLWSAVHGDLSDPAACRALEQSAQELITSAGGPIDAVAHDLHPDFFSTHLALRLAGERGIPALAVQHHHAHAAAVLAEQGGDGPVIALALDGVGWGPDGTAWGGEVLWVHGARYQRVGHLKPLALPGGDVAAREPWRMAASVLHALGRGDEIERRFPGSAAQAVREMLERGVQSPPTSSCGRWFDAAAGLLGIKPVAAFEGQAAMLLEGLAERAPSACAYEGGYAIRADNTLDLLPALGELAAAKETDTAAARFHATLAAGLAEWVARSAAETGMRSVALGGGCFMNRILARALTATLAERGIEVLAARAVPPNDGGLSLGQAWVAMQLMRNS